MAFGAGTINSAAGAVSDIFAGEATASGLRLKAHGDLAEAGNYDLASSLADKNAQYVVDSTAIKEAQAQRTIFKTLGGQQADIAAAGFQNSGSALDLMRESAEQGALTKSVIQKQGDITEAGYQEQAQSYTNMSAAARYAAGVENKEADTAETNGEITGGIKAAAAVASIFI